MIIYKVGLVDDHPLFARALKNLLSDAADLEYVGAGGTVDQLLAQGPVPDVVVLDLRLGDGTTPHENVQRIRGLGGEALIYTSGEHPELLRSAARAGVLGAVLKSEAEERVVEAIRSVARGEQVITTEWAAALDGDPDLAAVDLSPQQQKVLTRYASGQTAVHIAAELHITVDTVNDYLKRIRLRYAEAGRPTRTKLDFFRRALEDGWLPYPTRRPSRR
ncbi:response regulator transcription factor [Nocardia fluminea]|uniref:response regulator transcription factor n=1 Tax=Nocardia fluminea TaxID=134984 RepID=UPI00366763F5